MWQFASPEMAGKLVKSEQQVPTEGLQEGLGIRRQGSRIPLQQYFSTRGSQYFGGLNHLFTGDP